MRTTVELPPELMRAAKARSAESGESLKALLTRAVSAELGSQPVRLGARERVTLPLFGAASGRRVRPSNVDLERALADADAVQVGESVPPHRARRRRGRPR